MIEGEGVLQSVGRRVAVCPEPADVVEQHIEARVGCQDFIRQSPHLGLRRHIGNEDIDRRVARLASDGDGGLFGTWPVAAGNAHPGSDGGQGDRCGSTDAARATGDQDVLACHRR